MKKVIVLAVLMLFCVVQTAFSDKIDIINVVNGGFETGDFTGWMVSGSNLLVDDNPHSVIKGTDTI